MHLDCENEYGGRQNGDHIKKYVCVYRGIHLSHDQRDHADDEGNDHRDIRLLRRRIGEEYDDPGLTLCRLCAIRVLLAELTEAVEHKISQQ